MHIYIHSHSHFFNSFYLETSEGIRYEKWHINSIQIWLPWKNLDVSIYEKQQIAIKESFDDLYFTKVSCDLWFYDKLAIIFDANPDLNLENIWNCDESRFPIDPGKSKVIAPHNKPGFKLPYDVCRENLTTLAVFNATGKVLGPLIIFQGKNFQSLWCEDMALSNTFYGVTINGWMETDVFKT